MSPDYRIAANGIADPEAQTRMEGQRSHSAKILAGVDGRSAHDAALGTAARLSQALGAELHIVTVHQRRPWQEVLALDVEFPQPELDEYFREVEHQLRTAADSLGAHVTSVTASKGDPGEVILKHIERISPDMVVLCRNRRPGTSRHGMSLGSTSKKVSCGSPCPVVLVPPTSGG